MRGWKLIPWLLGVALVVTTLVGAKLLPTEGGSAAPAPVKPAAPAASDGLVAKGTVQSDPPPLAYGLPAHLQAGRLEKILVKDGQDVKVGDPLFQFDDAFLLNDQAKAEAAYNVAYSSYQEALAKQSQHAKGKELKQLAITDATQKRDQAKRAVELSRDALERSLKLNRELTTDAERDRQRKDDPGVFQAESLLAGAELQVRQKTLEAESYDRMAEEIAAVLQKAAAAGTVAKADIERAKLAVAECTVRAKAAGVIEQIGASTGQVVYPQTRPPLLTLVPAGRRVVWAEVVPEFAHKIKDRVGQKVTVSDDSNTHLTYEGTVVRVGSAFLPKLSRADLLTGKASDVLMVEIEVTDATPAGKSPLRVGQPVRVTFP